MKQRWNQLDVGRMVESARDAITVKRVFGKPYEHDGVVVIPAARIRGGAGGGSGRGGAGSDASGTGSGGGFGIAAEPAGAFVLKDGTVSWMSASNRDRAVLAFTSIVVFGLLTLRTVAKRTRARSR